MSITLPDKNRNVDVNEIIKLYNLPDDTKRIVQRTKTKISKEPGKTHMFYDRVYLISPSAKTIYHFWRDGLCKEVKGHKNLCKEVKGHKNKNTVNLIDDERKSVVIVKSNVLFEKVASYSSNVICI